jgi:serine/threonine protein phosphatase PrpC
MQSNIGSRNENQNFYGSGQTKFGEHIVVCDGMDSRIYQLRNGKIIHRTSDHSQVFDLVRLGIITEEQARLSDKPNVITRSLGTKLTLDFPEYPCKV